MDWHFLARYAGIYTLGLGGGTTAVAYVLPGNYQGYGLLAVIALGALLLGKAVIQSGGAGPVSGGDPASASAGMENSGDAFAARDLAPSSAGLVFYGVGLVVFGVAALSTIAS